MARRNPNPAAIRFHLIILVTIASLFATFGSIASAQIFTNLHQLTQVLATNQVVIGKLDLEATVCAASGTRMGVLIMHDASGVELLQLGDLQSDFQPGERIRIQSEFCLLRRRESGVQISPLPVVRNDGLHPWAGVTRETFLRAGKIPVRLEWFNYWRQSGLDVLHSTTNEPPRPLPASNLWHAVIDEAGKTNFVPGLLAECYEGNWESLPDFNLLQPVKTAVVTNFNLGIRSRAERVGIRYSGFLEIPQEGRYRFSLWSDDGSLLFLGDPRVPVLSLGRSESPLLIQNEQSGAQFSSMDERRWIAVEGRVSFVTRMGAGLRFDLGTARHVVSVFLADATGLDIATLPNSRVRIAGVGRAITAADQSLVLGKLFAASAASLTFIEPALGTGTQKLPLTSVAQVQSLPIEEARKALPVRIRGTVTGGVNTSQERWMSFQDDTRGIFVRLTGISNAIPASGELWELEGHSGTGDFAPVIIAKQITRLGESLLPAPVSPTWSELLNGSRDVQWAELKGLVTDVRSNTISLHLPEGRLEVELEGSSKNELQPFLKSVVKIRGVLYAVWNAATREVRVGQVMIRNATISVDTPAPMDPFDAVLRTPRELLLFDAQASAFRPVKVCGQIVYADATKLFLQAEETGMRLLPMGNNEARPGDLVEVVLKRRARPRCRRPRNWRTQAHPN
jgi:hypothetical protein